MYQEIIKHQHTKVVTYLVNVTPKLATEILEKCGMPGNRKSSYAKYYSIIMQRNGSWKITGETIKFAEDGTLLDGHNRLQAVILAGKPVMLEFRFGLDYNSYKEMDSGNKRTLPQRLMILGYNYTSTLSSVIKALYFYDKGLIPFSRGRMHIIKTSNTLMTKDDAFYIEYLETEHPSLSDYITSYGQATFKPITNTMCSFLYYLLRKNDNIKIFLDKVKTGIGIVTKDDPVYALRTQLEKTDKDGNAIYGTPYEKVLLMYKAYQEFNIGKKRRHYYRIDDREYKIFPEII